jgi:acyl-CoA synthetase (AMP-forming)/AMP-acid ligase II
MVEMRGPNVTSGYWRMPEKTRAEFPPTVSLSPVISARSTDAAISGCSGAARTW